MNKKYNLAIYTTFCGSWKYKTFKRLIVNNLYEHFFISNNQKVLKEVEKLGWKPLFLNEEINEDKTISAIQAKFAKAMPHKFSELKNYDYTFYIDDKGIPSIPKIEKSIEYLNNNNSSFGIRAHPWLQNNNLFEFAEAMDQPRYKKEWFKTVEYISSSIKNGYKLEGQMYWTSAILRNMNHPDINKINELWFDHILKCGANCQISFNFISQKFNSISILPSDLTN